MVDSSRFIVTLMVLALLVASSPAHAEEQRRYSKEFTGAFWEPFARGGYRAAPAREMSGFTFDGGLRTAFVFFLADTRISYGQDRLRNDTGDLTMTRHHIGVFLAYHPLYLFLLTNRLSAYILSSWNVELGTGPEFARHNQADGTRFGWFFSAGTGVDIPLRNPNKGQAPWLNVAYRFQSGRLVIDDANESLRTHGIFAGLSWRFNGLLF